MIDPAVVTALRAPFPATRAAALRQIEKDGLRMPDLAAEIARRLGDDDQRVRDQALSTFEAVGRGATAAVQVLGDLTKSGDPEVAGRALSCLAVVGPVASRAAPRVADRLDHPDLGAGALETLVAIAPDHPAIPWALGEALFEPAFERWGRAAALLEQVRPGVVDAALGRILDAVRPGYGPDLSRGLRLLPAFASLRPVEVLPLAVELLEDDDATRVRPALAALARMGPAGLAALPGVLARLRRDPEVQDVALEAIRAMGPTAARAVPVLLEIVDGGGDIGLVAEAARALRALRPDPTVVVPTLARSVLAGLPHHETADWWAIGECAETLGIVAGGTSHAGGVVHVLEEALTHATMALADPAARDTVVECAEAVLRGLVALGLAARRTLPLLVSLLDAGEIGPAAAAAIPALDRGGCTRIDVEAAGFPWVTSEVETEADEVEPGAWLAARQLEPLVADELERARATARTFADVRFGAPPHEVVRSLGRALERLCPDVGDDEGLADLGFELGALWGEQVVRAAGWTWADLAWSDGSAPAVVSPDRRHACLPARLLADAIEARRASRVTEVFDRIVRDDLPPSAPGELAIVG